MATPCTFDPLKPSLLGYKYYVTKVQLPLLILLLLLAWIAIVIRGWLVWKHMSWRSCHGLSTGLVTLSAGICTLYLIILKIEDKVTAQGGSSATAIIGAERILLTGALWIIKFAFMAIFFETRAFVSKKLQTLLWLSLITLSATAVAVVVVMAIPLAQFVGSNQDFGIPSYAILTAWGFRTSFAYNYQVEFIQTILDIATDLMMLYVALMIASTFRPTLSAANLLIVVMIGTTVSFALARLGICSYLMLVYNSAVNSAPDDPQLRGLCDELASNRPAAYEILSEMEPFYATIIATFPAMRAFIRMKGPRRLSHAVTNRVHLELRSSCQRERPGEAYKDRSLSYDSEGGFDVARRC